MAIFVVGLNHKTAALHVREKLFFSPDRVALYLKDLLQTGCAHEAVLLSTCNRSELYCETDDLECVKSWFCQQAQGQLNPNEILNALYIYKDGNAVKHIMRVACGLDSMILGEPQILGQMKDAFSESCSASAIGTVFHRLFQQVFAVAKEVRTATAIGACPVSVSSAAIHFASETLNGFAEKNIVVIGAGDAATLLLKYLTPHPHGGITLINRHGEKAHELAMSFGARTYPYSELSEVIASADVVFSATGSPVPIITQSTVRNRNSRQLILIDIAVPRDVAADVDELPNVTLYCIDHLKKIIENNRLGREHAAEKAQEMIAFQAEEFVRQMHTLDKVTYTIRAYRGHIEDLCRAELQKAKEQLFQGDDPLDVLDAFANAFTKKLLHTPSVQLRQAGAEGKFEILRLAKQLFAIPDSETERL